MKYKLITPFQDKAQRHVTEVDMREIVTGADILESRRATRSVRESIVIDGKPQGFTIKDPTEQHYHLLARLTGLMFDDILRMDERDIEALSVELETLRAPKALPSSQSESPK